MSTVAAAPSLKQRRSHAKLIGFVLFFAVTAFVTYMKLRYTEPAADDFENGISYFREHAPSLVADFADSIDGAIAQLLDNPYLVQETDMPGVRRWYIRRFRYSIFYVIEGDELVILHIRHAARRWPWEDSD